MNEITSSDIIYEDNHLIVCNKKSGILVQADYTGDLPLVELIRAYIKKKYRKPGNVYVGMVHRLDRPTSGCVLFTKTSKAVERMQNVFKKREIDKTYWALVSKKRIPLEDILTNFILKSEDKNIVYCLDKEQSGTKYAELSYEVIGHFDNRQLLEIDLRTGRKHQIRAQLSKIGVPIVGDLKYGYPTPNKDKSICLHCRSLSFKHPVRKEPITITAPPPNIPEWAGVK